MPTLIHCAGLVNDSIVDGPGFRYVIFAQGCPHHCKGCHNPATHPFEGGTPHETDKLLANIRANPLLSGVTFSGGEPFAQIEGFLALAKKIKEIPLEIAAYSGYTLEELLHMSKINQNLLELLHFIDIIIDGPFIEIQKKFDLHFRGSANQRTIDVQKSLAANTAVLNTDPRWN